MNFKNYINNNKKLHYILVLISLSILGLLLSLVFYFIAAFDVFYLYDNNIIIKLNGSYNVDTIIKNKNYKETDMKWSSSDEEIATVDNKGIIKGKKTGSTIITVKSKFRLFKRKINVKVSNFNISSIAVDDDYIELKVGDKYNIHTIINNDIDIRSDLLFSSSDDTIATVDSKGHVKAISEGPSTIIIKDKNSDVYTTLNINVVAKNDVVTVVMPDNSDSDDEKIIDIESITTNSSKINLFVGDTKNISAIVKPDNATNKDLLYTSSDPKIAYVSQSGIIKAYKPGICNIFISSSASNISTTVVLHIEEKVSLESVSYDEKEINLDIGEKYLLVPDIKPSNASIKKVYYISSNPLVASVDSNGKITGLKNGTSKIIAITKDENKIVTINVNVSNKKIKIKDIGDIDITNFKSTMYSGETNKININTTNDNIKLNLTMSSPETATITQDGLINALKPGVVYLDIESQDGKYNNKKMITILPGDVYAELISMNKYASMLEIGDKIKINATVLPEHAKNKKLIWSSSDDNIASVDNKGNITANGIGTVTITAKVVGSGVSRSTKVAVVGNDNIIDIKESILTEYYKNFRIFEKDGSAVRTMQNFAIGNFGKSNEILYVSYPYISHVTSKSLSSYSKKGLTETIVVKIPKSTLYTPSSNNRKYMYLQSSGHGQSIDLDINQNYLWVNGNSIITRDSAGAYWGGNLSNIKVKFTSNNRNKSPKVLQRVTIKNDNGEYYNNPEIAFDWENDLAALRSGGSVFIYKASDLNKGKKTLMYQFYMQARTIDGTNYYRQGHSIKNGYYYQLRGTVGSKMYVEVFNYAGEFKYTYTFNPKLNKQEPEGLKIYDNKIFVGITTPCPNCTGRLNSVYYFK